MACSQASQYCRTVTLDIETISLDPANHNGALSALTGKIACVAMLIEDGDSVAELVRAGESERDLITFFWQTVGPRDLIVGHNVLEFDLQFILQRSWILGIRPSRTFDTRKYYSLDVVDTLQLWSNGGKKKGASLEALAAALDCGSKIGEGNKVAEWWAAHDFDSIRTYCSQDVRLAYRLFCRLTYRTQPVHAGAEQKSSGPAVPTNTLNCGSRQQWFGATVRNLPGTAKSPLGETLGSCVQLDDTPLKKKEVA